MINKEQLEQITDYIAHQIMQDHSIMFDEKIRDYEGNSVDLVEIIAALHNLLYEAVTGIRYDYMFHWANKIGAWVEDDALDEFLK